MSLLVILVIVLLVLMFVGPGVQFRNPLGVIVAILLVLIVLNLMGVI